MKNIRSLDGLAKVYESEKAFHKMTIRLAQNINEQSMEKTKEIIPARLVSVSKRKDAKYPINWRTPMGHYT